MPSPSQTHMHTKGGSKSMIPSSSQLSLPSVNGEYSNSNIDYNEMKRSSKAVSMLMNDNNNNNNGKMNANNRKSTGNMSTASLRNGYKYDILDKCVDCFCCCNKSFQIWIHNLDRVYISILIVVILALIVGCSFATLWYFYGASEQTITAMELAVQSIGERARNRLAFEYWIPQLFTGYLLSGLQTNAYNIYSAYNDKSDIFFSNFHDISHTSSMFSIYMYNVNNNSMYGSYYIQSENKTIIRSIINNCDKRYEYDINSNKRIGNIDNIQCGNYNPKEEFWFQQSQHMNYSKSEWSEPHRIPELNDAYGMTLITRFNYSGSEIILLAQVTSETLDNIVDVTHLPSGTVLFVVTPRKSVISATNGELVIQNVSIEDSASGEEIECQSSETQTCDTLEHFSEAMGELVSDKKIKLDIDKYVYKGYTDEGLTVFGFSFYMFYTDYFGNKINLANYESKNVHEVGFIVISYDESYLNNIYISFYLSWCLLLFMIIVSCIIICCNVKTDQQIQKLTIPAGVRAASIGQTRNNHTTKMINSVSNQFKQTGYSHKKINTNTNTQTKLSRDTPDVDVILEEEDENTDYSTSDDDNNQKIDVKIDTIISENDTHIEQKQNLSVANKSVTVNSGTMSTNAVLDNIYDVVIDQKSIEYPNIEIKKDNNDNILNLPDTKIISTDPEITDDHTPVLPQNHTSSIDSNTPLQLINENGRTDNMPNKTVDKKVVSFNKIVIPSPGPDGNENESKHSPQLSFDDFTPNSTSVPEPEPMDVSNVFNNSWIEQDNNKSLSMKICSCSPIQLIIIVFILIVISFLSIIGIWVIGTNITSSNLIDSLMVKQEYFAVSDEVYKIFDSSDMIYDLISRSLKSGQITLDFTNMDDNQRREQLNAIDNLFIRMMRTFTEPNEKYRQYYIYMGTPAGFLQGARWREKADNAELLIGSRLLEPPPRNSSPGTPEIMGSYNTYAVDPITGFRDTSIDEISENNLYDPRCRGWYLNAIKHGFVGTIDNAFPKIGGFKTFYEPEDDIAALQTTQCKLARQEYIDLFQLNNFTYNNGEYINLTTNESRNFILNGDKNESELYGITWDRYVFASLLQQGLTASSVVVDDSTGNLLGVVSIDYTLDDLSQVLSDSVGNETDWFAWIFESSTDEPYVIASSDGQVLVEADSIEGCIQLAETNEQIPVLATEHNNSIIRIMSKEIVRVYEIEYINNISFGDGDGDIEPQDLKVPIDLPKLEVGRIHYYSDENKQIDSIDWIIAKTINTGEIESGESNDMTISFLVLVMLMAVVGITFREFKSGGGTEKRINNDKINADEYDVEDLDEMKYNKNDKLGYHKKMRKMKHIIQGSANILWKLACDDYAGIITTKSAKDFMAQRANQHVSANENNNFMFLMCALEFKNEWNRLKFLQFMNSNLYQIPMQFIIFLHLIMTIFEPSTPLQLLKNGMDAILIIIILICILIEFMDIFLIGCQRYMEFTLNPAILKQLYQLNYGIQHKYCRQLRKMNNNIYELELNKFI
eukprot:536741_1